MLTWQAVTAASSSVTFHILSKTLQKIFQIIIFVIIALKFLCIINLNYIKLI